MGDERIRIATSIPSLKDKIKTNIVGSSDVIYWFIKFNIPLDETTVSYKTMEVMDIAGYIMRTDISYNKDSNIIVISPLDSYEQGVFYILTISKKVRSLKGQTLRSKIHIVFKLLDNKISEYKVLKKDAKTPKPKPRPKDYDTNVKFKVYSFDPLKLNSSRDKLPTAPIKVNLLLGVVGLILIIASVPVGNLVFTIVSILIGAAGAAHIGVQLQKKSIRSSILYNRGVRKFNNSLYNESEILFKKALIADESNEYAEYAVSKVQYYL